MVGAAERTAEVVLVDGEVAEEQAGPSGQQGIKGRIERPPFLHAASSPAACSRSATSSLSQSPTSPVGRRPADSAAGMLTHVRQQLVNRPVGAGRDDPGEVVVTAGFQHGE